MALIYQDRRCKMPRYKIAVTGFRYSHLDSFQISPFHPLDVDKLFNQKSKASHSLSTSIYRFTILTGAMVLQVAKLLESQPMEPQAEGKDFLKQLQAHAVQVQASKASWEESKAAQAVMTQVGRVC